MSDFPVGRGRGRARPQVAESEIGDEERTSPVEQLGRGRGRARLQVTGGGEGVGGDDGHTSPVRQLGRGRGRARGIAVTTGEGGPTSGDSTTSGTPPPASPSGSGSSTPTSGDSPTPGALETGVESLRIAPKGLVTPSDRVQKEIGNDGMTMPAVVNYVRVAKKKDTAIYEYHVRFIPDVDSIRMRRQLMYSPEVRAVIGDVLSFTGMNLFLPKNIGNVQAQTKLPTDGSAITVKIEFVKQPPEEELIPFYNTLFRRVMSILKMVQINRHYYVPANKVDIPQHKLEARNTIARTFVNFYHLAGLAWLGGRYPRARWRLADGLRRVAPRVANFDRSRVADGCQEE